MYKGLISQVVIPILALIFGIIFRDKIKSFGNYVKSRVFNKQKAGNDIIANSSHNQNIQNQSPNSPVVYGNYSHNSSVDTEAVKMMACGYINLTFPHIEKALNKRKTNALHFLEVLDNELKDQPLERFAEASVQVALKYAIDGASSTDEVDIHKTLSHLLRERVSKSNSNLVDLTINEAIATTSKINLNLIKLLGFSFLFSRTKLTKITTLASVYDHLKMVIKEFSSLEVSDSQFEYLESISCGKTNTIGANTTLSNNIKSFYPQVFTKKISAEEMNTIQLDEHLKNLILINNNNQYSLIPALGIYIFEDVQIFNTKNKEPIILSENEKEQIKKVFVQFQLSNEEVRGLILEAIPDYQKIEDLWNKNNFPNFILNTQGIALGRAYLEQSQFGKYDINIWIK